MTANSELMDNKEIDDMLNGDDLPSEDTVVNLDNSIEKAMKKPNEVGAKAQTKEFPKPNKGMAFAPTLLEKYPWVKRKKTIACAVVVALAVVAVSLPQVRNQVDSWLSDSGTMPTLFNGQVKDPLWQVRLNELSDKTLQTSQANSSRIASVENGMNQVAGSAAMSREAIAMIQETNIQVGQMNIILNGVVARVGQLENDLMEVAVSKQTEDLTPIKDALNGLTSELQSLTEVVTTNQKNSGWYANRISKLEGWVDTQVTPTVSLAQRVLNPNSSSTTVSNAPVGNSSNIELVERNGWVLRAASSQSNVAWILNTVTNEKLRVTKGKVIPRCGKVTSISSSSGIVKTAMCEIKRDS